MCIVLVLIITVMSRTSRVSPNVGIDCSSASLNMSGFSLSTSTLFQLKKKIVQLIQNPLPEVLSIVVQLVHNVEGVKLIMQGVKCITKSVRSR